MKIAIIWHRLGPYHIARAGALASASGATVIELSGLDRTYDWDSTRGITEGFNRLTLFDKDDSEDLAPVLVNRSLDSAFNNLRPDVLLIPGWGTSYAASALRWAIQNRCPRVLFSETGSGDKSRRGLAEWVKRQVVRNYGVGLVGGERHVQYMEQLGIPRERIWLGYNCVDNDYFMREADKARANATQLRERMELPARYWLLTCRFITKKNLPRFLRSYATFLQNQKSQDDAPSLVLMGDGPLRSELESLIGELKIEAKVVMPGFKQYDELPIYYGLAEAFILPSLEEQWGLVVNEAMASGLPVMVSSHCNCTVELVQPRNGFTFDPKDSEALVNVMEQFSKLTAAEREAMGAASREIISGFSTARFAESVWAAAAAAIEHTPKRASLMSRILLNLLARRRNVPDV